MKKNINQILKVIFATTVCLAFSGCIGVFDAGTDSHEKQEHVSQEFLNSEINSKEQSGQSQVTDNKEDFFKPVNSFNQLTEDINRGNLKLLGLEATNKDLPLFITVDGAYYCPESTCRNLSMAEARAENYAFCKNRDLVAISAKNKILLGSYVDAEYRKFLNDLQENISVLSFSNSCDSLFIGTVSGRIYHWKYLQSDDDINNPWLTAYQGHAAVVNNILMHNASRLFFSLDWNGNFFAWLTYENSAENLRDKDNPFWPRFWLEDASRMKRKLNSPAESFYQSADGQQLLLKTKEGKLQIWQVRGFEMLCESSADFKVKKLKANGDFNNLLVTDSLDRLYSARISPAANLSMANCQFETKAISSGSDLPVRAFVPLNNDSLWLWQDKLQKIKY